MKANLLEPGKKEQVSRDKWKSSNSRGRVGSILYGGKDIVEKV